MLAWADTGLAAIMMEGKVSESFGPPLDQWLTGASPGKLERLEFLKLTLGLGRNIPGTIRYQLLHRSASALLTARAFHARYALMLVHSFSPELTGFADYSVFLELYGVTAEVGKLLKMESEGVEFLCGWVRDIQP